MHEILEHLPRNARVLDLGCREGSFAADAYAFLTVRVDLNRPSGHVNLFDSPTRLEKMLAWYFDLPHVATRTLFSSLSFLNRRNTREAGVRAQMRFGGFFEPVLLLVYAGMRLMDRLLRARTGVYGWAIYFGSIAETVEVRPRTNVCIAAAKRILRGH